MKNKKLGYAALAIALVLLNVIALVIPLYRTSTFWIVYIFTDVAFIAQIPIWKAAFKSAETLKSNFLGIPIVNVGLVYLILQIIAFIILVVINNVAFWVTIIICVAILAISVISIIAGEVSKTEISQIEVKVHAKSMFIKKLQSDIELIANTEKESVDKDALAKLAETVCYSDPMSDASLAEIENIIIGKLAEIKVSSDKVAVIDEISTLLTERNNKVKLLK